MGSFSWTRAESTTRRSNITYGDKYKILVPKEFGGGYIKDIYFDYGQVFRVDKSYGCYVDGAGGAHRFEDIADLYGILAYGNRCEPMEYPGIAYPQTMIDILKYGLTDAQHNRCRGIRIGCYSGDIDRLQYPLKLVSASYRGTYEDCKGRSYADPNQGFGKYKWSHPDYADILAKLQEAATAKLESVDATSAEAEEIRNLRDIQIHIQIADCCTCIESIKELVKFSDSAAQKLVDKALWCLTTADALVKASSFTSGADHGKT